MIPLLPAVVLGASFVSVQVGSFTEESRAIHVVDELRDAGHPAFFLRFASPEEGESTYKVRVGSFPDNAAARAAAVRIKEAGYPGAFPTPTDLAETQGLSADLTALVGALGAVNPGRVKNEAVGKRLRTYTQNYLTLFLLAAGSDPGMKMTDLAVWDTNPDNQPELFPVVDASRAYALFWVPAESRYGVAELLRGQRLSIGDAFDLTAGPEKFIAVRYERGGDLYREAGYEFFRWKHADRNFTRVGRLPLEIVDRGEERGLGLSRKRTVEASSVDPDPDRELLVRDSVDTGGSTKEHVDVWDWDGTRLERVASIDYFEKVLANAPGDATAAEGLFGLGIELGLDGRLEDSQKVFQRLVSKYPQFEVSKRAMAAIQQIGERRERARALNQTGFDEIRSGAPDLAEEDLEDAVRLDPGNAAAHYNLAAARAALGDPVGALRALRRALELDTDDTMKLREKARADADLAPLRPLPEFKEILRL